MEIGEHRLLHKLGVQRRDTVDRMRADKGEIAHTHAAVAIFLDQRDAGDLLARELVGRTCLKQHLRVDRIDNLHVARQQPLEQRHRPAFQGLGKKGVIGVGEGALGGIPGDVEIHAVDVHQEPHQLRHGDRGMGVVEMDCRLVG